MEKLVYLLQEARDTAGAVLRKRMLAVADEIAANGGTKIVVNVNDDDVSQGARVTIGSLDPPIRAMVSFWMTNSDDRAAAEQLIQNAAEQIAGYLVVESVPTVNTAHVTAPAERTPGVNMVTCINRKPDVPQDEFFRIWYTDHKLVAQQTQSTFGYIRNTVVRPLTENAPPRDGVVEEFFPIEALSDQKIWYAAKSDEELQANLGRMIGSVQRFLDLGPLESHPMSRYEL